MAGKATLEFTDSNFDSDVISSSQPVLVDFWAEWCGPCRALAPTIDALAEEYQGQAKIGKLDIEANQDTAFNFSIASIPTVILFKDGKPHKKFVGLTNKEEFKAAIDALLATA